MAKKERNRMTPAKQLNREFVLAQREKRAVTKQKEMLVDKDNKMWEELNELYVSTVKSTERAEARLLGFIKLIKETPQLAACMLDGVQYAKTLKAYAHTVSAYYRSLRTLYAKHKTKKGGAKTLEEVDQVNEYLGTYAEIQRTHILLGVPLSMHLAELIDEARELYSSKLEQLQAQPA